MKRKLLFVAALAASVLGMKAQWTPVENVIQNADFEGEYTVPVHPHGNRDISQPDGWTVNCTYTGNEEAWYSAILTNTQATYDNIKNGGITIPAEGEGRGLQTYAVRCPYNDGALITLSQTLKNLPAGSYRISGSFFTKNQNELETGFYFGEYSAETRVKYTSGNGAWRTLTTNFISNGKDDIVIGIFFKHTSGNDMVAGVDNIVLEKMGDDFTECLTNPAVTSASGWINGKTESNQQYTDAPDNTYLNNWNASSDMYQTVTLPQGVYRLTAATRASEALPVGNLYVRVEADETRQYSADINKAGGTGNKLGNGWDLTTIENIVVDTESAKVTIGFYSECPDELWAGADNFKLEFVREYNAAAELETAKKQSPILAKAYTDDVDAFIGETAFSISASNSYISDVQAKATALDEAIIAEGATLTSIQSALDALKEAKDALYRNLKSVEFNAPVAGQAYVLTLTTSDDSYKLNTEDGIKIEKEGTPIYLVAQDGGTYAIYNGEKYVGRTGANDWTLGLLDNAYSWTIALVGHGKFSIKGDIGLLGTNAADKAESSPCYGNKKKSNGNYIWTASELPTVIVKSVGVATYVAPVDVEFGDDVKAYVVSNVEGGYAILDKVDEVPAGTPVIVEAEEGSHVLTAIEGATAPAKNELKASTGEESGKNIYVLANFDNEVGFYALAEGEFLPAGKAYLENVQGIKFIGFSFGDDATGIKGVETATEAENAVIYNLAGQRVANPTKGIYIVNGKKVLVK